MVTADKVDELLKYFHQELAYLRNKGGEFAERYPKVAGFLELGPDGSTDPHVERLIESVAFLTARMQRDVHKKFPEYTQQLLGSLYPHLTALVPPFSFARFTPDVTKISSPDGFLVPKETELFVNDVEGNSCFFKTSYETRLWPISVESVRIADLEDLGVKNARKSASKAISIRLRSEGLPFSKLNIQNLDFFLQGEKMFTHQLFDAVMTSAKNIYMRSDDQKLIRHMTGARFANVGFDPSQQLFPMPGNSHPAYGVMMDYATFPKKFHYISLWNIDFSRTNETCEIVLPISDVEIKEVSANNFCLGCVPIINLFQKASEPLKLDHTALKYKLTPDVQKEATTEIQSIQNVIIINDQTGVSETVPPYFASQTGEASLNSKLSWHIEREASRFGGSDFYLSFVDQDFDPKVLTTATVYAETLCTNRHMSNDIPVGSRLIPSVEIPAKNIETLMHATPARFVADTDEAYWKLISHLSVNHLSLTSQNGRGLKDLLRLYLEGEDHALIDAVSEVEQHIVTRRLTTDAWRGFVQGIEVIVTLDKPKLEGYSPLIFGGVMRQFLALYASINSFVEFKLKWKQTGEIWKEWAPISGRQQLL